MQGHGTGPGPGPGAGPKVRADSAPTAAEDVTEGQIVSTGDLAPPPVVPRSMIHGETSDAGISFLRRFQPGIVISGRYRLERMIARGGMGCVFLATQLPLGRQVAIKFLTVQEPSKEFRRRFLLEASTCARLVHRHIVTVHDYGETDDGDLYMAMEYLNGEPLSKVITKSVRFPAERACRVALQVCRALRAAHLAGVVHRDLKPSNVMLLEDEDEDAHLGGDFVKVLDFGLVKAMEPNNALAKERAAERHDLTRAGVLLGSPRYMAPEQIRSEPVTPATDVYSLGVILFHMIAGRPPFIGANSVEILNQHLKDPVPALHDVAPDAEPSPELEVVIRRCMEKSPTDRYASMEELISDLKAAYRLIAGLSFGAELAPGELAVDDAPHDVLAALRSPGDGRATGRIAVGALGLGTPKPGTLTPPGGAPTSTPPGTLTKTIPSSRPSPSSAPSPSNASKAPSAAARGAPKPPAPPVAPVALEIPSAVPSAAPEPAPVIDATARQPAPAGLSTTPRPRVASARLDDDDAPPPRLRSRAPLFALAALVVVALAFAVTRLTGPSTDTPPRAEVRGEPEMKPGEVKPGEVKPGEVKPGEVKPGEVPATARAAGGVDVDRAPEPTAAEPTAREAAEPERVEPSPTEVRAPERADVRAAERRDAATKADVKRTAAKVTRPRAERAAPRTGPVEDPDEAEQAEAAKRAEAAKKAEPAKTDAKTSVDDEPKRSTVVDRDRARVPLVDDPIPVVE